MGSRQKEFSFNISGLSSFHFIYGFSPERIFLQYFEDILNRGSVLLCRVCSKIRWSDLEIFRLGLPFRFHALSLRKEENADYGLVNTTEYLVRNQQQADDKILSSERVFVPSCNTSPNKTFVPQFHVTPCGVRVKVEKLFRKIHTVFIPRISSAFAQF